MSLLIIIISVTLSIAKSVCLLIANLLRFMVINQATVATVFVLLRHRDNMFILRNSCVISTKCFKLANINVTSDIIPFLRKQYIYTYLNIFACSQLP